MIRAIVPIVCGTLLAAWAAAASDYSWVTQHVRELQPTSKEKRLDEIGWAADIREARRLAKAHQRAVFLFTHDGHINIGRC